MHFILRVLLVSFPMLTMEYCTLDHNQLKCKELDMEGYLKEFFSKPYHENEHQYEIVIENSSIATIEFFPSLPLNRTYFDFVIVYLSLKNSSVEYIEKTALKDFDYLKTLDLSRNNIQNVSFLAPVGRSLQFLDLSHNKIKTIDFNIIGSIKIFNISNNNIDTLKPATSKIYLDRIDLSYNRIVHFSELDLKLVSTYLDISYNDLYSVELFTYKYFFSISGNNNLTNVSIPVGFTYLYASFSTLLPVTNQLHVNKLHLQNKIITVLNNLTLKYILFSDSAELDLSNCSIVDISDYTFSTIDKEGNLELLNLSGNNIKHLGNNAFYNLIVTRLDLSRSNITDIENFAFNGLQCTNLNLQGNKVNCLKNKFNNLTVQVLDLSLNPLIIIRNNSFINSNSIKTLNFSRCFIERIERQAFLSLNVLEILDLSYNKLYVLESNTFSNLPLQILVLHGARIDTIQKRAFENLPNLKVLNMSRVGIRSLESFSFSNLTVCEILDLSNNNIPTIPQNLFVYFPKIHTVHLDGNNITTFNPFSKNIRLQFLSISFNRVLKIRSICNIYLQRLHIKYSTITQLKGNTFRDCYKLLELRLDNSYIGQIEANALNGLINLRTIDARILLNHTKIIKQSMFQDLYKLQSINISHLSLERLESKAFMGLKSIRTLLLDNNHLTELAEDAFYELPSLIFLDVSHNKIVSINNISFRGLENLKTLNLSFNNLIKVDANIFSSILGPIEQLHLDHNEISSLSIDSFQGLKLLRKLYLQDNKLDDFPVGVFKHLPNLKLLNLSNNMLQLLKTGAFSNLEVLTFLDLSGNKLVNLDNIHLFFSLKLLERLMLDNNHLKKIEIKKFLRNSPKVKYIGISGNKWNCNTLSDLIDSLSILRVSYRSEIPVYDADNINGVGCLDICKFVYCSNINITDLVH